MKKNLWWFCILFYSKMSKRKEFLLREREEGVKWFHNKLGTTDARFLSYNGISLLSQQAAGHCIVPRTAEDATYLRRGQIFSLLLRWKVLFVK